MTKKIKFLNKPEILCLYNLSTNKEYLITGETDIHYKFYDDKHEEKLLLKSNLGFHYQLVDEPKVQKYIKLTKTENPSITPDQWYEINNENEEYYELINNAKGFIIIPKSESNYVVSEGHPNKHFIKKAAELAEYTMDVGSHFQFQMLNGDWVDCHPTSMLTFDIDTNFRIKPHTIKIGNREINAPARKKLEEGEIYYYPVLSNEKLFAWGEWDNYDHDEYLLKNGLVFLTKEDAIAAAELIIELLKGDE